MDTITATPTTASPGGGGGSGVSNLFSTIAGDISVDTVNSVISDLNLFRSGTSSLVHHHWDTTPTTSHCSSLMMESRDDGGTQGAMSVAPNTSLQSSEPGPSSENFSQTEHCSLSAYNIPSMNGIDEAVMNLPMTPPTSDSGPPSSSTDTPTASGGGNHSDSDTDMPPRKKRAPVPSEKKDDRYWDRRKKNNVAAKRSRELRRKKIDEELKQAQDSIQENQKLKQEIEVLKAEINSLRRLLKDANMTLSLWIRAKQTSEPNSQLPPMLRGPNVPFVNFPVSSNV